MPRAGWIAVALLGVGLAPPAAAQPLGPLEPISPLAATSSPPLGSTPVSQNRSSTSTSQQPAPIAGAPILGAPVDVSERPITRTTFVDTPTNSKSPRAAALGVPRANDSSAMINPAPASVPAAVVDAAVSRTAAQPTAADPVNDFLKARSELKEREASRDTDKSGWALSARKVGDWGKKVSEVVGEQGGGWFRSDHLHDNIASPVTNPFLFEDPRSLTEVRPIFIYQRIPTSSRDFFGGSVSYFGTQARVAFTDRWSLVFSKFGGIVLSPHDPSPFGNSTGFAELWLGPKWTFYRGEENGIVAAGGLQFQIPVGSKNTFQDTGDLSLVPYLSYAQNFFRDFSYGSFNLMANTGYSFSVNNQRSDYYWLSAHLDFDVANLHRFYPLMELNWFLVTTDGHSRPIGIEGRDLINFGGQAAGTGLLTGAFGGRVKLSEAAQLGSAFEFPFAGRKDLFRYRFTMDFILRY
jgi:hypothetical protein